MLPWTGHNAYSLSSSSDQSSPANSTAPLFPPTGTNTVNPGNTATYDTQRSSITPITNPEPSNPSPPPSLLPPPPPPPAPIQQPLPAPAPITLSSTLHFLQTEHRRYARDRNEWEIERAEMRARVALLEGEKRGNEGALRDLARRCRMLEGVLRAERSKFLSLTNQSNSPSASGTSSPLQGPALNSNSPPIGQPIVPVEPHHLSQSSEPREESVKQDGVSPQPADAGTTSNEQVSSTAEPALPASAESLAATNKLRAGAAMISNPLLSRVANGYSGSSGSGAAGTSIGGGATGIASSSSGSHYGMAGGASSGNGSTPVGVPGSSATRDLRGKARSRDYLKQCLQEITYLTASTTLNPLSSTSFAAPGIPRPRKVLLPVPPAGIPAPAPLDNTTPTSLSNQQNSADSVKKDALPAGMYLLKGSKVPISITASSSTSLAASTPSPVQSEFAPASTYTPPGDSASVFIPLQREPSERGRGSGRSISAEMEGEREGINERRLAPGGLGEERKRAAGETSGAWLNSTSSVLPASTIAQERGVDSMTGTMPAVAAANVIDNRLEDLKLSTTTSDPAPNPLPTTAAEIIPHHLPSPPRSPSPAPPVFVSPLSSPGPSSASVSTSYINANNAPSSFTTKPTTSATSKPTASPSTTNSNGGVESDLNSLILETTRKEDPSPPESNESGLVWEHDNGSISTEAPAAILDGDKLGAEAGKDSTTTTKKSSGGSKSKKNKKTAGTLPLVGDTTAVESLP